MQNSIERRKSNVAKIKMPKSNKASRVVSNTTRVSPKKDFKNSIRSAKVQMILERHKRSKNADKLTFNANNTMEDSRENIRNMTTEERREKSKSNLSLQAPQGSFLNLTLESAHLVNQNDKSIISDKSDIKFEQNKIHEDSISEEDDGDQSDQLLDSDEEKQDSVIIRDCNSQQDYIEDQYKRNYMKIKEHDNSKESFYLTAPMQFDINKLRKKVDLPPISESYKDVTSISKNTPLQSNSSKLMQQLQEKKMLNNSRQSHNNYERPQNNWSYSSKTSFIDKGKKGKIVHKPRPKNIPNSAMAQYSKGSSKLSKVTKTPMFSVDN